VSLLGSLKDLQGLGLVTDAAVKRVRIHMTYWSLRKAGRSQSESADITAGLFEVEVETVVKYAKGKDRYSIGGGGGGTEKYLDLED
jgi:hypothetical protein